jgi:hypothetical protein
MAATLTVQREKVAEAVKNGVVKEEDLVKALQRQEKDEDDQERAFALYLGQFSVGERVRWEGKESIMSTKKRFGVVRKVGKKYLTVDEVDHDKARVPNPRSGGTSDVIVPLWDKVRTRAVLVDNALKVKDGHQYSYWY